MCAPLAGICCHLRRRSIMKRLPFLKSLGSQRLAAAALFLALPALAPAGASAQLIDPNQQCVYQPGSTECSPITAPQLPAVSGTPYDQFLGLLVDWGVDQSQH